jgi:hypothetical protein
VAAAAFVIDINVKIDNQTPVIKGVRRRRQVSLTDVSLKEPHEWN